MRVQYGSRSSTRQLGRLNYLNLIEPALNNIEPVFNFHFMQHLRRIVRKSLLHLYKALTHAGSVNYQNKGFIHLIDVGAIGDLPSPWFENARFVKKLLRFEPRESASQSPDIISLDCALGSRNEQRPFHIYQGNYSHGSSFYEPNREYVTANFDTLKHTGSPKLAATWHQRSALLKTLTLQCKTLDTVLQELNLDYAFDFLKIDAQGAEHEILTGSERFLKEHCLGLQLELFRLPLYKGIKLKEEVIRFLDERGFELVKELPPHGTFHCANDCIFLKKEVPANAVEKIKFFLKIYGV